MTNVFFPKNIRKGNIIFLDMLSLYIVIPFMEKKVILKKIAVTSVLR